MPELALFVSKHLPFVNKWVSARSSLAAKANKKELFFDHSIVKFPIENAIDIAASTEFTYSFITFLCVLLIKNIENIVLKVFLIGKISMLMNVRLFTKDNAADFLNGILKVGNGKILRVLISHK